AWSWRSRDEPVPYGFLPFQRKDRTIKPWDQTPSRVGRRIGIANLKHRSLSPVVAAFPEYCLSRRRARDLVAAGSG
ncbi:hypothetical protein, partial [Sphingomonas sp. Leaf67]|uniref:hypothetical protein n=1 Tax=Sphingomonas sp. Leaf67 TaxID=1736230 RepID=UPI001F2433E0